MMAKIRRGCFETNSSSVHTICISPKDIMPNDYPSIVYFEGGRFGWEYDEFWDVNSKAAYLLTMIVGIYGLDTNEEREATDKIVNMLSEEGIECNFDYIDFYRHDAYIDHVEDWTEFLPQIINNKDLLFRYLFGDSVVITGNDNDYSVSDVRRLANRLEYDDGYEVFA